MYNCISISDVKVDFPVDVNNKLNDKVRSFVEKLKGKQQSIHYYSENRNADVSKAINDKINGKKAEYFASKMLRINYGFPTLMPDVEIREGSGKGWSADLPYNELIFPNVHVKSCTPSTLKYVGDYSWTFQYGNVSGRGGRDDIFKLPDNADDLVVLIYLETPYSPEATVKAVVPWRILKKYLSDPKKKSLIGLKKCVNYKDLLMHKQEIESG